MKTYTRQSSPSPNATEATSPASTAPAIANVTAGMAEAKGKEYQQIEPGVQYVPAPKPPTLLEILPAEYETTRPPLLYRLSTVSEPARPPGRIAESRTYRARAFSCGFFYKPVSRCLVDWEER